MHPYVAIWLWAMKGLLKVAAPMYLVGAVGVVVFGGSSRMPEHDAILELSGYEMPVLIGIGDHQRSDLVVPRVFYRPSIYSVTELTPSEFGRIEMSGGAFIYIFVLVVAAWGSWRFPIFGWRPRTRVSDA